MATTSSQYRRRSLSGSGPLAFNYTSADADVDSNASTFCLPANYGIASAAGINGTATSLIAPGLAVVRFSLNQVQCFHC